MQTFEVIHSGAHAPAKRVEGRPIDAGEPIEIGTKIELKDGEPLPGYLVGKVRQIGGKVAVTNPAEGAVGGDGDPAKLQSAQERQELLAEGVKLLDDEDFGVDGVPKIDALNALIQDESVAKFTAKERDELWPGIKDAAMAARNA